MSNKKFIVDSNQAPRAIGPYSQAVGYDGLLYLSQQLPVDARSGRVSPAGVEQQTRLMMDNVQAILMAAGLDFSHVLKTTLYLRNLNDFEIVNDIYALYFDHSPPARSVVEVNRLLHDSLLAIDLVAAVPADYTEGREDLNYDDTSLDHPGPPDDLEPEEAGPAVEFVSEDDEAGDSESADDGEAPGGTPDVSDDMFESESTEDGEASEDAQSASDESAKPESASAPGLKPPPTLPPLSKLPLPKPAKEDS